MRMARDIRASKERHSRVGQVLAEALPWIRSATGKTIVIKYGGSAMVDEQLRAQVMADVVLLKIIGMNPVIVHGGGKAISEAMKRLNLPVSFKDGLRVTDDEAMEVVRAVLVGQVNQDLVRDLNRHGNLAVGLSGVDGGTVMTEPLSPELGHVGRVTAVNAGLINDIVADAYIPVIASIGMGQDGTYYNINADIVAGEVAAAIGAHKIVFLTDVDGLYEDFSDKNSLISRLTEDEAKAMLTSGNVGKGMIPKVRSCITALDAGVPRAHIVNGTIPHVLLLELLTDEGAGTVFVGDEADQNLDLHPLGKFAEKLVDNADDRTVPSSGVAAGASLGADAPTPTQSKPDIKE